MLRTATTTTKVQEYRTHRVQFALSVMRPEPVWVEIYKDVYYVVHGNGKKMQIFILSSPVLLPVLGGTENNEMQNWFFRNMSSIYRGLKRSASASRCQMSSPWWSTQETRKDAIISAGRLAKLPSEKIVKWFIVQGTDNFPFCPLAIIG